ncbi:MAG: elongation factor P [Ignavibacteria bacterium]|jgi:elongation factor P|nr:elongation factor P [Ignavibacteria bacterium]
MGSTSDLRPGVVIKFNGENCQVLESEHRTPGNLRAFYQVKMRNLKTGKKLENRFASGESIEIVRVEKRNYQYLYNDGQSLIFMNPEDYEQIPIDPAILGDQINFLRENDEVSLSFEGTSCLSAELPASVNLLITHTEPGLKGDTATNVTKPATVETGATVLVPLFINEGDTIRVDTRNGSYMDRVKV